MGFISAGSRMRQVVRRPDATMRAKRVMTANLTRTKTVGSNRVNISPDRIEISIPVSK
jgi:hypothetical protein